MRHLENLVSVNSQTLILEYPYFLVSCFFSQASPRSGQCEEKASGNVGHDTQDEIPFVSLSKDEYETDDVRIAMIGELEGFARRHIHTQFTGTHVQPWYRGGMRLD